MMEILATGPLNTVQDLGRFGYRNVGVTTSGAMDPLALRAANILLGNAETAATIEVQTFPFRLRFDRDGAIAITGADCRPVLDGVPLPPWWALPVRAGQVLELTAPVSGARSYLAVAGGIDVPVVLGSRSTALRGDFGGLDGRALQQGDRLAACAAPLPNLPAAGLGVVPPETALAAHFPARDETGALVLRALPSGEHDLFGRDAERFWAQEWKISAQSNRTGYRLSGEPIHPDTPVEMRSHGLVPGVVQVPPAGEPIIQMSDANTAGGYPKIAGVIEIDLWRLGQARIGSRIRLERSDVATAIAAEKAVEAWLSDIRHTAAMVTDALAGMAGRQGRSEHED
ncbi:biotin-dependent carboxyltransferase family protein [Sinirhodobacter populi]|uniref:Biotin-dependent carboxyltransferase family protein n=2 Tax=Paenirhodobacter populi TaxID=2306993 RepID=A0A443K5L4_9RHOB|nr:biotin-dependent carboxyltransferase family protein [Sinirhodobacter populi]